MNSYIIIASGRPTLGISSCSDRREKASTWLHKPNYELSHDTKRWSMVERGEVNSDELEANLPVSHCLYHSCNEGQRRTENGQEDTNLLGSRRPTLFRVSNRHDISPTILPINKAMTMAQTVIPVSHTWEHMHANANVMAIQIKKVLARDNENRRLGHTKNAPVVPFRN